jgi:hypothetical protein
MGGTVWVVVLLLLALPLQADAFWGTKGNANAFHNWEGTKNLPFYYAEAPFFFGSISNSSVVPDYEGHSRATAGVNMDLGLLWVATQAQHRSDHAAVLGTANAVLYDDIWIHVTAGTYPAGVFATVEGRFTGTIDLSGDTNTWVQANWEVVFWNQVHFDSIELHASPSWDVNGTVHHVFDDPFSLTIMIVGPGTVVYEDIMTPVGFSMAIGWPQTGGGGAAASNSQEGDWLGAPPYFGEASLDMLSTGRLESVEVTEGQGWSSSSGVLLVPEPGALTCLASGVALLPLLARLRRKAG